MDLYLYKGRVDLAATTLADLNLMIAALADESDTDNVATIAMVTSKIATLVQADTGEPLTVYSYDDSSGTVSSWVTNAAVTVEIGLGDPDPVSGGTYAYTASTTISGSSRTATLSLNTAELAAALSRKVYGGRDSANFTLHIRKTESSVTETVALLSISVAAGVISTLAAAINETINIGEANAASLTVTDATLATSITTGAIKSVGGISTQDEIYAQRFNGSSAVSSFMRATSGNGYESAMIFTQAGWRTWKLRIPAASTSLLITDSSGSVDAITIAAGSGNVSLAGKLTVAGTVIHTLSATPASASAAGTAGTIAWDSSYVYVCVATNTWKRTALATW